MSRVRGTVFHCTLVLSGVHGTELDATLVSFHAGETGAIRLSFRPTSMDPSSVRLAFCLGPPGTGAIRSYGRSRRVISAMFVQNDKAGLLTRGVLPGRFEVFWD